MDSSRLRSQAFSNVVWDVSKEAQREDISYWENRVPLLAALDSHQHLLTAHSSWYKMADLKHKYYGMIS